MKKIFGIVRSVFVASIFLTGVSSCQLFENDVADFMEKYTETAAIERHDFNVGTYEDSNSRLCIASEADTQISLYMRNPKKFNLVPSVTFPELGSQFSTSYVDINQTDSSRIELSLPQEFLIPVDEGQNITAEVRLYEPMSGRDFDRYKISLSCNTIPPLILNSTIFNVGNSTFGVAFDMPNPSEVAIRHKDISEIEINGKTFPVTITTEDDPEIEGAYVAKYTIEDSHFVRSLPSSYSFLGEKTFEHKDSTSFYYVTDDPFVNGEKEYTLILRDRAGLKSEAKASTTISRLAKPLILDQSGNEIEEGVVANIPYDEETERGTVTVIPPTRDHHGDSVSGTTVYYKVYDASGSGKLYTSGSTTTAKTINLPQNTYRIEAYAVLTNYENSPTTSVKCRLMNNVIYVAPLTAPITDPSTAVTYDGSAIHPFTSIQEVIDDINANRTGENRKSKYTILIKGDFTDQTYSVSSPNPLLDNGSVTVGQIETDELVFEQWPGEEAAKLNTISVSSGLVSSSTLKKVKIGKITLGSSHHAGKLDLNGEITYEIDGTVIKNPNNYSNSTGINVSSGADVTIKSCTISDYEEGIKVSGSTLVINNISIASCDYGISITSGEVTMNKGVIKAGCCVKNQGTFTLNDGSIGGGSYSASTYGITNNGNASVINLYGGKITENNCGIDAGVGTINVKGKPEVYGNVGVDETGVSETCNIKLGEDKKINIVGPLTSGCKLGIYVNENNKPAGVGDKYVFTEGYHLKNTSVAPSTYFISDSDLSIVLSGNEAGVALTGGNGNMGGGAFDYHFDFVVSDALDSTNEPVGFYPGEKKEIYIKPVITNGSEVVAYTSIKNDVDWTAFVYNGGTVAETLTPVATDSGIKLTLSGSITAIGSYNIKVAALYSSINHDLSVPLTCSKTVEFAASYISKLTASATVEVTGALDADGLGKIKTALTTLYSNNPNVRVKIDAGETSCEHPSDLNTGGYFRGCDALSEMILPDWMANIPPSLFENCSNLTSVTIAGTVSYIYDAAFAGCTSLTTVNYNGSKSDWGKIERAIGWHEGIPSVTEVTCENGEKCSLDYDGESSDPNSGATVPETVAALGSTAPTSGTYTLSTLAELQQIQAWVNAGKTLSGVTFVLASDIDTGTTKMIIGKYTNSGSEDRAFAGVFDGNGHTIKNTISTTSISFNTQFEALFAYVKGENAEIKNLTVDGTSTSNSIVGLLDGGATVDHCISKTTINVKVSDGVTNAFAIGGIVGSLKNGKITNCINAGTIGTIGNNSGTLYAGGIVGYVGDTQTSTKSLIENCINKGSLNFKSTVDAGGIAGIVSLKTQIIIRNCKNKGSVKTDNSISNDSSKVGGIVGSLTSADSIINNFNSGDVTVPNNTQNRSGGIVGYLGSSSIPVNANCNIGRADYGIVGKLPGGAQRQDILDYSRINYYLAATGSLGSSSDSEMKIWSDCEFTTSTAQNIVNNLSNSGDYKGWKLNNSGLPELDLGELDNICNSL